MQSDVVYSIHFQPLVAHEALIALGIFAAVVALASLWRQPRAFTGRVIALAILFVALLNPSVLSEEREPVGDVAAMVIDESGSQSVGQRTQVTNEAADRIVEKLNAIEGLETRVIRAPPDTADGTRLFSALDAALADVPESRRAGVFMITDGQIHDAPKNPETHADYGPVHVLLSGDKDEKDRQIDILNAPAYGIVGQSITIRYIVRDANTDARNATVTLQPGLGRPIVRTVPVGEEQTIEAEVGHAGQNVFELRANTLDGEITHENNAVTFVTNGIRDRLKVLLVSGLPYIGERTWRNILTSDPGIDLIHFTILRTPDKRDRTPLRERALIEFPVRELFDTKLNDFDLIVFDRFRLHTLINRRYFTNIANYVARGGALLVASGPDFASNDLSIYNTSLRTILPAAPTGTVIEKRFMPELTDTGQLHPVTQNLGGGMGPWLRQIPLNVQSGDVLMNGEDEKPLLILDRVGEGRVAQLGSDQIWLWARGYEGGGPHYEILRRLMHWLMKEPELDENAIDVRVDGNQITIRRRAIAQDSGPVRMTKPNGETENIDMPGAEDGWAQTVITADQNGVYAFENNEIVRFGIVGALRKKERESLITTEDVLDRVVDHSGGGFVWAAEDGVPDIRALPATSSRFAGNGWAALKRNNDYIVSGIRSTPLFPTWLAVTGILLALVFAWWREGRGSR